jgi:hypothetical protein
VVRTSQIPCSQGVGWGEKTKAGKGELFMETSEIHSKSIKRLAKSLPVIIFLFIVFACGFAAIVLHLSKDGLENNVFWLICGLAGLSLIGFIVFLLVAKAKIKARSSNPKQQILERMNDIKKISEEISEQYKIKNSIRKKAEEESNKIYKIIDSIIKKTADKEIETISKTTDSVLKQIEEILNDQLNDQLKISKLCKIIDSIIKKAGKKIKTISKKIEKLEKLKKKLETN